MAYNDFTLDMLKQQFDLRTDEQSDYFAQVAPVAISEWLRDYLSQYVPLALAISTEKARSELLITPVLVATHRQLHYGFSLFSGVEFNVDMARGLRGVCDYLLSLSPEQLTVEVPVVVVVEAKNENMKQGINSALPRWWPHSSSTRSGTTLSRRCTAWLRQGTSGSFCVWWEPSSLSTGWNTTLKKWSVSSVS